MGSLAACVGAPQKDPKNAKNLAFPPKLLFFTLRLAGPPGKSNVVMSRSLGKFVAGVKYGDRGIARWLGICDTHILLSFRALGLGEECSLLLLKLVRFSRQIERPRPLGRASDEALVRKNSRKESFLGAKGMGRP